MYKYDIRDQRGVGMVLELVLVAAVLALVGLALYQSNHRPAPTASSNTAPVTINTSQAADSAAKAVEQDANTELNVSSAAETSADAELSATDADITNLGDTANDANNF